MEDDDLTIDISSVVSINAPDTISVGSVWLDTATNNINVYDTSSEWITISANDIDISSLNFPTAIEWEHEFPAFHKVEEMCKQYPALEKAYENFKTIYKMVEQDYIGKKKDDDVPF